MIPADHGIGAVEVKPEVVFLHELMQDLADGRIRVPRFQRPFVWRRDQMTDLLDSVLKQYPIGSLLLWETDELIPTLDKLGPFSFPGPTGARRSYLLDGHQRLSTLAGALLVPASTSADEFDSDPGKWRLAYDLAGNRFVHADAENDQSELFPLNALLDTLRFFSQVDHLRRERSERGLETD